LRNKSGFATLTSIYNTLIKAASKVAVNNKRMANLFFYRKDRKWQSTQAENLDKSPQEIVNCPIPNMGRSFLHKKEQYPNLQT
jgi:hypothetical protein